jgi:predicted transcriptional regulator
VRKLGFSATELSKKLGVSQPSVSISVKRGEQIAKTEQLELGEDYKDIFFKKDKKNDS